MTTLRWPDGRGQFRDSDTSRTPDDVDVLVVGPGTTVDVDDPDTVDHYLDRGFEVVDADEPPKVPPEDAGTPDDGDDPQGEDPEDTDADGSDSDFDVDAFLDRTPVSDVVDDIEAGEADDHLDVVADAADRVTVERAVEDRQEDIGGD